MAGGFQDKIKKLVINSIVDYPGQCYVAVGVLLYFKRRHEMIQEYNQRFGKFDYDRKVEANLI